MGDFGDDFYDYEREEKGGRKVGLCSQWFVFVVAALFLSVSLTATVFSNATMLYRDFEAARIEVSRERLGAGSMLKQPFCRILTGTASTQMHSEHSDAVYLSPAPCIAANLTLTEPEWSQVLRNFTNRYAVCEAGRCVQYARLMIEWASWYAIIGMPLALAVMWYTWRAMGDNTHKIDIVQARMIYAALAAQQGNKARPLGPDNLIAWNDKASLSDKNKKE